MRSFGYYFAISKAKLYYSRADILFRVAVTYYEVNNTVNNDTQLARDLHRMHERRLHERVQIDERIEMSDM